MLRPGSFALTVLLSSLTALAPLSMDMYLPSLPDIGASLGAPTAQVQLTIASYLFGFGTGQIFYGPASDRFGRRPVILVAIAIFGIASVACVVAPSIHALIAARFIQAVGGAGASVLARAVVRDIYSGTRAGRELSLMGSITALAPIVAPMIGGMLQTAFGWRSCFVLLVVFAAASATVVTFLLPETLHKRMSGPFSLAAMGALYRSILVNRGFRANLGILTASFVGLFAWISGAPIVMQGHVYGLSPLLFGFTFSIGAVGYLTGTFIGSRIVMRVGLDRVMGLGTLAMTAGGLIMIAVIASGAVNVIWFVGTMTIFLAGAGLTLPSSMAGALTPFPDRAGTASSVMGFVQQSSAGLAAAGLGLYLGHSAWPVVVVVAVSGAAACLIWALTHDARAAELAKS
jgi:DHA1 family bicyclomycin/chloramphenicol resistance-like MFS transporter